MGRAWSHHGSKRRRCGYLTFLTFDLAGEYVTMNKILRLPVALVIMISFSFLNSARGAEEPEAQGPSDRKIQLAGGALTLEAPKSWEKKKPRFNIIEYEFSAKGPDEESAAARITIMGAGGSLKANVDRWKSQFRQVTSAKQTESKIGGQTVHLIDIKGVYRDRAGGPFSGGKEKLLPDYRMLGAIVVTDGKGQYFIKIIGPEKTLAKQDKELEAALKTMKLDPSKKPTDR